MTGFELVAGVIGVFFVTGVVMGVLIVSVLPRWRGRRYMRGGDWHELPRPRDDDDERPPRWPRDRGLSSSRSADSPADSSSAEAEVPKSSDLGTSGYDLLLGRWAGSRGSTVSVPQFLR